MVEDKDLAVRVPIIPVKFQFFKRFASFLRELLVCFQTERPILPFLSNSLVQLLRKFIKNFVSAKALAEVNTPYKLATVDLTKKHVCLPAELVILAQ